MRAARPWLPVVAAALAGAAACMIGAAGPVEPLAGALLGGSLAVAGRHPRPAWVAAVAVLAALAPVGLSWPLALLGTAHAFAAGRRERRWAAVLALGGLVGALELGVLLASDSPVPALIVPAAAWAAGRALREREIVAAQLRERVRELEEEREAHAQLSVRYERARIASELHDIVAHALSVMVVQASAGQRLAAHDLDATAEAFEAIAEAARQAEGDMARLVALLGDEHGVGPAPDLALVEELVARASASGLDVTLRLEGEREGLPAPVARAAYHVVQEGLTNALRYAAGAAVCVCVHGGRDTLVVEVANGPAGRSVLAGVGSGTGLQGLRERVGPCGGTLHAGATEEGGWLLSARMPRLVAAANP